MTQEELSRSSDLELLDKAKEIKTTPITDAVLIGIMVGIVIYSVAKNSWGFLTLIPLYFIYQLIKKSKSNEALEKVLKEKGLK